MNSKIKIIRDTLLKVSDNVGHYEAKEKNDQYIVWAEDGDNDLLAGNVHAERCYTGTVDLYTRTDSDPLFSAIPAALEGLGASYYLNSVQYEEETGLVNYEWVWEVV